MSGPAAAGVLIYAKNLDLLAQFYAQILGMRELHRRDEIVVLQSAHLQLLIHAIPAPIAEHVHVSTPPAKRENVALKFFATVDSMAAARALAAQLGGQVHCTDLRQVIHENGIDQYNFFFKTDHHWTPEGAFWCWGQVA